MSDDRWSDVELAPVKLLVTGKAWRFAGWIICAVYVCLLVLQLKPGHSHGIFPFSLLILPLQAMARLRQMMLPSVSRKLTPLQDWKGFKPMQSDHWGEAGKV